MHCENHNLNRDACIASLDKINYNFKQGRQLKNRSESLGCNRFVQGLLTQEEIICKPNVHYKRPLKEYELFQSGDIKRFKNDLNDTINTFVTKVI